MPPQARSRSKSRESFTAHEKLEAATALERTQDVRSVVRDRYPNLTDAAYESRRKLVLRWLQNKDKLEAQCAALNGSGKRKARPQGIGTKLPPSADDELVTWVSDLPKEGVPISSKMLALESMEIAAKHEIEGFCASWRWERGFKARHRLSMRSRTRSGQKTPADLADIAAAFAVKVRAAMLDLGVNKVYNADQTAAFFEFLPTKTINAKGAKTIWVRCAGKSKERATVMLLGDSDGVKYRPFVVFKVNLSKTPIVAKENERLRCGFGKTMWKDVNVARSEQHLEIYGNPKGWWNRKLSVEFLRYHFGERSNLEIPVLPLWDDFSGHWTEEVVSFAKSINVVLMKVPKNATSVCQPADVALNYPFKADLRECWVEHLREQLRAQKLGKKFELEAPGGAKVAKWIRSAWDGLSEATIANGYRKAFGALLDDTDVAAADLIQNLTRHCASVDEVQSDDIDTK